MATRLDRLCANGACRAKSLPGKTYCRVCLDESKQKKRDRRYDDSKRESAAKRGYGSRWDKTRKGFLKKHPNCVECGDPATVVDHIIPFRKGDEPDWDLFWLRENWQSMCKRCHDSKTAKGE